MFIKIGKKSKNYNIYINCQNRFGKKIILTQQLHSLPALKFSSYYYSFLNKQFYLSHNAEADEFYLLVNYQYLTIKFEEICHHILFLLLILNIIQAIFLFVESKLFFMPMQPVVINLVIESEVMKVLLVLLVSFFYSRNQLGLKYQDFDKIQIYLLMNQSLFYYKIAKINQLVCRNQHYFY